MTDVHIINRLPTAMLHNKTPYEILYNKPADYDHLKEFGCLVVSSNPAVVIDKFTARGCLVCCWDILQVTKVINCWI